MYFPKFYHVLRLWSIEIYNHLKTRFILLSELQLKIDFIKKKNVNSIAFNWFLVIFLTFGGL